MNLNFDNVIYENKSRANQELEEIARQIRKDVIISLTLAGSGHTGGSLGVSDLISALYFGGIMRYNPQDWKWNGRDRFVLSAGHLAPVLYSALARSGFFPPQELSTLRKYGSRLQGHPSRDKNLPGIETASGSLGQGISIAVGMAMNDLLIEKTDKKVFCLTGDGEIQEGIVWEAAMAASNYKLRNLCWILDNNDCQIDGRVKDVMSIYPIYEKFESFGFNIIEIDGHNFSEIISAYKKFIEYSNTEGAKPTCIIAKTFMGKGVSYMEDDYSWHGNPPKLAQAEIALKELERN